MAFVIVIGMASPLWDGARLADGMSFGGLAMADHGHVHAADLYGTPGDHQPSALAPVGADHVHEATIPASDAVPASAEWRQPWAPPPSDGLTVAGVSPHDRPPRRAS
ncbi:hypothetical protein [Roseomonas sp. USHLN139]|uniref:hypothetical protein n=1 Tax=Roseomonas sp. USHLN139 TaxID=3081298 RepID=UPI003B0167E4